ncbi:NAD-dependent epimerase/dehydratase family protein [Nonomuraea sp. MCN248]|uniref:NAD-dependent epimerase/dehydratase family protein n=1 Tax=Nonomuraea corallina TaxID=2989783 RepID=A0ABT4SJT6_9ACTN|nr:NAD-dependent epimerase/dehydratase family protein [Nonomuraea corallina]MDA0637454.1 NAD-dependent epimerase/dehydratase family protein [Nonomuraea corallina]
MRVLLLGGAGFIGLHLAARLVADGHEVTVIDDFSRGRRDPELAGLADRIEIRSADLTDPASYAGLEHRWDHVYLLAAVVGVRNVVSDPARVIRVNTLVLMHLLDWIAPGARLFFASTSEAYAGGVSSGVVPVPTPESVPLVIEDVGSPRYTYAISKLLGEAAVLHTAAAKGFGAVVGRFHNVYGPRMGADHVIPELSLRALRGADPFDLYGADQSRAFCYVDDAVRAMMALMDTPEAGGRIVHIGDDTEETNIGDLAKLVLRVAGVSPAIRVLPAPTGSVARRCPDLTLLRRLTGYEPRVPLEEGVRRTYTWYRESWTG